MSRETYELRSIWWSRFSICSARQEGFKVFRATHPFPLPGGDLDGPASKKILNPINGVFGGADLQSAVFFPDRSGRLKICRTGLRPFGLRSLWWGGIVFCPLLRWGMADYKSAPHGLRPSELAQTSDLLNPSPDPETHRRHVRRRRLGRIRGGGEVVEASNSSRWICVSPLRGPAWRCRPQRD